jgi:hypothetical protein
MYFPHPSPFSSLFREETSSIYEGSICKGSFIHPSIHSSIPAAPHAIQAVQPTRLGWFLLESEKLHRRATKVSARSRRDIKPPPTPSQPNRRSLSRPNRFKHIHIHTPGLTRPMRPVVKGMTPSCVVAVVPRIKVTHPRIAYRYIHASEFP